MCEYYYEKQLGINPTDFYWNEKESNEQKYIELEKQKHKYGFDEREIWNLDMTFCAWIYPRLKMFRECTDSHPSVLTMEQWHEILDTMIEGFGLHLKDNIEDDERFDKIQKSINLFSKWFLDFWI